ncbi:hypothetical protein NHQ30_000096 [Ciborinia camelliae]|nr:hypothetical protein NHQ30_000096 [Ciborinia camelliae]
MQLINYLPILAVLSPALGLPAPAVISTNPNILPMCTKQLSPNTCVLNWNTNTMAVNDDLSNMNNFMAYAHVTIYSNTCSQIGGITNGLTQNVMVNGEGLSSGIILQNRWDAARGYNVPTWVYNKELYTVDNCVCFDGPVVGQPKDTHVCECPFECKP